AYGESGQEPGAYQTLATYATTAFGDGGWGPSITPTQAGFGGLATGPRKPQDNLKPERTKELTGGVDLGLFKDRADAHFTYYHDRTTDVIFLAPLPVTTGYSQQVQNAANILNVGYEVSLNVRPVVTGDVTWEIAGQWATNDNRVTDLSGAKFVDLPGAFAGAPGAAVLGSRVGVLRGNDFARCGITSRDRKSTRLNSSHLVISYAVFCLKKKNNKMQVNTHMIHIFTEGDLQLHGHIPTYLCK